MLGLHCCTGFSPVVESGVYFLVDLRRLLVAVASLVVKYKLQSTVSIVVAYRLSCSPACGIFPDQWWNLCLLHWQADSLPISLARVFFVLSFCFILAFHVTELNWTMHAWERQCNLEVCAIPLPQLDEISDTDLTHVELSTCLQLIWHSHALPFPHLP